MSEFKAMLQLLAMLATDPRIVMLFLLLIVAAASDYRSYRIPNWLTVGGGLFGIAYNALVPAYPSIGLVGALEGYTLGLAVLFPFYVLKIMGAGDVKLFAMVGAFVGAPDVMYVIGWTFVIGGIAACMLTLARGTLGRMLANVKQLMGVAVFTVAGGIKPEFQLGGGISAGKLPYAISIAVGTIAFILARQLAFF
ncbi:MAG: A24 family peptidase [Burkholderiaceae bacterium]